jgi:hypothetical protein
LGSGSFLVFLAIVWSSSMQFPTAHCTTDWKLAAKLRFGNTEPSRTVYSLVMVRFLFFAALKGHFSQHRFTSDEV